MEGNNIKEKGKFSNVKIVISIFTICSAAFFGATGLLGYGLCGMGGCNTSDYVQFEAMSLGSIFGIVAGIISIISRNSEHKVLSIIATILYLIYIITSSFLFEGWQEDLSKGLDLAIYIIYSFVVTIVLPFIGAIINTLSVFPTKIRNK